MVEQRHIACPGDSPHRIEQKYRVSWATIQAHPANAFIRTRRGYPIQPGDIITVPSQNASSLTPGAFDREIMRGFQEFLRIVESNIKLLTSLTMQHPASTTAKVHSTALPKVNPGVKATHPSAVVGYKKALPKVRSSVVLTTSIEFAFDVLQPALPVGAVMTSGYRSDADQARVINDYFAKHDGPSAIVEVEERRQWLRQEKGLIIARVGGSPHRTGLAFDLSGADLDSMNAVVERCANTNETRFPLLSTIVERNQNCLHVNLKY